MKNVMLLAVVLIGMVLVQGCNAGRCGTPFLSWPCTDAEMLWCCVECEELKQDHVRRTAYISTYITISDRVRDCIMAGKVFLGMTKQQCQASWGRPVDINESVGSWGVHEQWVYGHQYLYFENGILTSWQN